MSNAYARSINLGSTAYGGLFTPTIGPLSTNQTPTSMPFHNSGILTGSRPSPPQFYSSQEPVIFSQFINARRQYKHATPPVPLINKFKPMDSSMLIQRKKASAIGKSSANNNTSYEYTTKNVDRNVSNRAIRRVRSSGYIVPHKVSKKGMISN